MHPSLASLLSFFKTDHLPDHLAEIAKPFAELALGLVEDLHNKTEHPAELTAAIRKLLEAKDCAVRAALGSDQ